MEIRKHVLNKIKEVFETVKITELEKPYYQGEVLVYEFIPIEFILNINELISL